MDEVPRARLVNEAKFLSGLLYFNLVRLWGEVPLVLHEVASLSKESLQVKRALVQTGRLELMFEFQRWFDLVRTGRMVDALHKAGKSNAQNKHYLLPVPQRERELNPQLSQNQEW